jgi:hypothetical protein
MYLSHNSRAISIVAVKYSDQIGECDEALAECRRGAQVVQTPTQWVASREKVDWVDRTRVKRQAIQGRLKVVEKKKGRKISLSLSLVVLSPTDPGRNLIIART